MGGVDPCQCIPYRLQTVFILHSGLKCSVFLQAPRGHEHLYTHKLESAPFIPFYDLRYETALYAVRFDDGESSLELW